MQDSRPGTRVVSSLMWQAALGPIRGESAGPPDGKPPEAPADVGRGKKRVPAVHRGPGSQIRRYEPADRRKPAPTPATPSSPDPLKPPD